MIDQEWRDLMRDTVTLTAPASYTVNGEVVAGPGVSVVCRVMGQHKVLRGPQGDMVSSVHVILDRVVDGLTPEWGIQLPASWQPRTPPILSVTHHRDERGPFYSTIDC